MRKEEECLWRKARHSLRLPKSDTCGEGTDLPIALVVIGTDFHRSLGLLLPRVVSCYKLNYPSLQALALPPHASIVMAPLRDSLMRAPQADSLR